MKIPIAVLILLFTFSESHGKETSSENDITQQNHLGDGDNTGAQIGSAEQNAEAAPASTQQTCQPDIHTVLREMSALIAEQRVELRYTKTQMDALESRVRASETRLTASETTVVELRAVIKEQAAALRAVGGSVNMTGSQVEELRREREERRVSFSASLVSSGNEAKGPFGNTPTLVYKHVFNNAGNAYNPNTGIFTAPVRGVYHFVFFVFGNGHASTPTAVSLHKNGEHIVLAYGHHTSHQLTPSNGVTLLMEVGDVVYLKLWHNSWLRDSYNHHSTFSGHLLFPM